MTVYYADELVTLHLGDALTVPERARGRLCRLHRHQPRLGRRYVGIDLNAEYLDLSLRTRLAQGALDFGEAAS